MSRNKTYDPRKCQRRVIATVENAVGDRITLLAHHAFDWAIVIQRDGNTTITMMPREKARKEYKKRSKCYK
jgi:hypothetical protein